MSKPVGPRNAKTLGVRLSAMVAGTVLFWALSIPQIDSSQQDRSRTLESALVAGCRIAFASTGRVDDIRAWLDCGCGRMLMLHPMNLLSRVKIGTAGQALSFVRLFTSRDTYRYFPGPNRVEIVPGPEDGPFVLEAGKFHTLAAPLKVEQDVHRFGRVTFRITRTTVCLTSLALEEIVELVQEDGYYTLVSTRVLAEDATKLGIRFI